MTSKEEEEGFNDFDRFTLLAQQNKPLIDAALKNLLSVLIARDSLQFSPQTVLPCARLLIKKINAFTLVGPVEWGSLHPQQSSQSALERIEELTKYNVICSLRGLCIAKGGSICKLFGRSYLLWTGIWTEIKEGIITELANQKENSTLHSDINTEVMTVFLDCFTQSLQGIQHVYLNCYITLSDEYTLI